MEGPQELDLKATVDRLREQNSALRSALEATDHGRPLLQQSEEFARLLSVSQLVVSELDLAKVFALVADNARELVQAELLVVPELNEERSRYTYVAASGANADSIRGTSFKTSVRMCGWVLQHEQSLLFGETSTHWIDEKTTWEAGQQSAVLVPLVGRKGIIGGLSALGKQGGGCFTHHDLELLTMFANQVSVAVENARLFRDVTREIEERKEAESELSRNRNLLRQVLDAMPQSVFWKDRDGVYQGCNSVFAKAAGLGDPGRVAGLTDFDLPWPRAEAEAYRRDDRAVVADDRAMLHTVEPLQQAGGTRFWIDTSKVPLHDQDGRVSGVLGVYEDITDRIRAEEQLQRSERRLRESQKVARLGSWELDLGSQRLEWSDETFELFDCSPRDFVPSADHFARAVHPDDRARVQASSERALASDASPYHVVVRVVNDSGRLWVMEAFGAVRRDGDGKPLSIYGTAQDVTERERAEERFRENEKFIRNVLDTVDEGFIVVDRDYRILTANNAYCLQAGQQCDAVIGKPCFEVSHRRPRPCWEEAEECAVREAFATGEPRTVSHKHTDAAGGLVFVETKAYPMRDGAGSIVSAIETVTNITEKHLLEEERLRTQKLESIGTLAGGIAHDFNNLLQGVFGYISMAKYSADSKDKVLAMLEQSENALHQAVNLTTQLLTFSKGGKPVRKPINLRPVIENATRFTLSGSRSDFRINVPDGLWQVDADDGQVTQVIQNIVLNADQAMPTGGPVEVAAWNLAAGAAPLPPPLPPGAYVCISIRDNGIGIPERYLGKIFDPYFTTKEKGSGLGLATSYSIVKNHGGLIDVESRPGEGSTFTIYLPAAAGAAPVAPAAVPAKPVATRKARVLIMDDDEVIRNLSNELLRVLGHDVEVAQHGQEAVAAYRSAMAAGRPFDVVILDLTIRGGMGGVETVRQLLAVDPAVRAIVSSGYSDDATMADHLAHGFKGFLKKPYSVAALQKALAALID